MIETLFDTHTHLQFKAFKGLEDQVVEQSKADGVTHMVVVGTNIETSKTATLLAARHKGVYAGVGIHPHHIFEYLNPVILSETKNLKDPSSRPVGIQDDINQIEKLLEKDKVVAVGEVGMDRHLYTKTRHANYQVKDQLIALQREAFAAQINLALKHQKSLIIHNREAVKDTLEVLEANWDRRLEGRSVFHCCEPDDRLLDFAKAHKVFIGVDGDVTYDKDKQEFVKKVPLELLVLETDSPYLIPEGFNFPNTPANLAYIGEYIAKVLGILKEKLEKITSDNSKKLFRV